MALRDADYEAMDALIRESLTEDNFVAMVKEARSLSNWAWGLIEARDFVTRIYSDKFGRPPRIG